jgi:ParB family chromosome partitioning protein
MADSPKKFGLGKGLSSLIPGASAVSAPSKERIFYVEVGKINPNPDQPRQDFNKDGLKELADSIKKYGVLQPLLVSKIEVDTKSGRDVSYQLIAGERRWRASKLAGVPTVPVIIRDDFNQKNHRLEVALIENIQRKDLNPIEEAEAYDRLQKEFGLTQQEVAAKVAKSREAVANSVRLLKLSTEIKESLRSGLLSRAHARALLAFNDESQQKNVYQQILSGKLSTKEVEKIASVSKPSKDKNKTAVNKKFEDLAKNLGETLKVPVLIHSAENGGRIIIRFATLQELNKIAKSIID